MMEKCPSLNNFINSPLIQVIDIEGFSEYIAMKNYVNYFLIPEYQAEIFRRYRWFAHINKKRSTTKIIRKIKKTFGKDSIMIMGDWSDKLGASPQRIKYISTPNKWLKNKLAEHMTIYNIDEHRTSCLHYKTEQRCSNLWSKNPKNKGSFSKSNQDHEYKIHSVLTCKMENGRLGCINRDNNAVNNMIKITRAFLSGQPRPERYQRGIRLPEDDTTLDNPQLATAAVPNIHPHV
jgi:hypothetical protein